MASKSDFITEYRQQATQLLEALEALTGLKRQYDALGLSGSLVNGDFVGQNADLVAADFTTGVASVTTVMAAFDAGGTISDGHDTNIYKLKLGA